MSDIREAGNSSDAGGKGGLEQAVGCATDTRVVELGTGVIDGLVETYQKQFGDKPAIVVADRNTFEVAGRRVLQLFRDRGHPILDPVVFPEEILPAEYSYVTRLAVELKKHDSGAIAVGSGTINDLTKLASHQLGRKYMVVATAASMDGYTAFGASITHEGVKQTFYCPAATILVADTDIFAAAPEGMNAAGYADLLAKITAGADWIVADALEVEPINPIAWSLVQDRLRDWVSDPEGIRNKSALAAESLMTGLVMSGLAMQSDVSSRPASGAEHQFSHLWDMQGHRHQGRVPFHGFKVGIGMLASATLYEYAFGVDLSALDIEAICKDWPNPLVQMSQVKEAHKAAGISPAVARNVSAKFLDSDQLKQRLTRLQGIWPNLIDRLTVQLIPARELKAMIDSAGCPSEPESIGISRERLCRSIGMAQSIRPRFTILDLIHETRMLETAEHSIFGIGGFWGAESAD